MRGVRLGSDYENGLDTMQLALLTNGMVLILTKERKINSKDVLAANRYAS